MTQMLMRAPKLLLGFIDTWSDELANMNEGKVGKPFVYPESFLAMLAVIHAYLLPIHRIHQSSNPCL